MELDPAEVARVARGRVLLDGRNCMPGERWREAGWTDRALGRGVSTPADARALAGVVAAAVGSAAMARA